jgi:signal transduction histidine kinase
MVRDIGVAGLLDAMVGVVQNLGLPDLLHRIARSACDLVDARYGALGVIGPDGTLSEFIDVGIIDEQRARIGQPPTGKGILGLLIDQPRPLRLADLGAHGLAAGFPPNHPPMRSFLGVPVTVRGRVFGNLYLTEKRDGGEFTERDEEVAVALATVAGVAIENATLFDQVRRRERWLSASYDVTTALLADHDLDTTLGLIAERARVVAGASVGGIARLREGDRSMLVFDVVEPPGDDADRLAGLAVPTENTATGIAFTSRQPVVVREYGDHVIKQQGHAESLPPMLRDLDSTVAVPLIAGAETLGVLVVARFRDKAPFTDTEVQLAESFAGHAALAIQFARAEQDRRRLAVFEDRDRIARDLHDLVIQRLFATGLGLEGIGRLVTNTVAADRITGFVQDLDRTIRDIRNAIFSLQEPERAQGSLRSELLRTVLDAAGPLGFEPRIGLDGPLDSAVPDPVRSDLVGTLYEALSNVARHASATEVTIEVSVDRSGRRLALVVDDNGIGIPATPQRRSGLANMAERAARWRGTCSVRPAPGGGTRLEWTVILPADRSGGTARPEPRS